MGDGGGVALGHATCVRLIPEIIAEAHGDGGDFVAALGEEGADGIVFGGSIAFGEIRIAEPVPVVVVHQAGECGLVAHDFGLEGFERILVEIHVRPGVIAEGIAGVAPSLEDGEISRLLFKGGGVDEAVDGRKICGTESGEDFIGDDETCFVGRERAVGGEVVEGESDSGSGGGGEESEGDGKRYGGEESDKREASCSRRRHFGSPG